MWDELSASEKSELMRIFIKSGIRDLGTMRDLYNEYRGGGGIHIKPEIFNGKAYYRNGGIIEGDYEVDDITAEERNELKKLGYSVEIL